MVTGGVGYIKILLRPATGKKKLIEKRFEGISLSRLQPWSRGGRWRWGIINDGADRFTGKQLAKSDEGLAALDGCREGGRVLGWAGPQHHLQGQLGRLLKYAQAPTIRLVARRDSHVRRHRRQVRVRVDGRVQHLPVTFTFAWLIDDAGPIRVRRQLFVIFSEFRAFRWRSENTPSHRNVLKRFVYNNRD